MKAPRATPQVLSDLAPSEEAQILDFGETLSDDYRHRLRELGFREGEFVRCLRRPPLGAPRVYQVGGSVFSIESDVTRSIRLRQTP